MKFTKGFYNSVAKYSLLHKGRYNSKYKNAHQISILGRSMSSNSMFKFGRLLKVRYIVYTSLFGTGVVINQKIAYFKDKIPDISWLSEYIPNDDYLHSLKSRAFSAVNNLSLPTIKMPTQTHIGFKAIKGWFEDGPTPSAEADQIIDDTETPEEILEVLEDVQESGDVKEDLDFIDESSVWVVKTAAESESILVASSFAPQGDESEAIQLIIDEKEKEIEDLKSQIAEVEGKNKSLLEKNQQLQDDMKDIMQTQFQSQHAMEKLEKDSKELKQQILLLKEQKIVMQRKMKMSLIDMYSDVLDELAEYDKTFNSQDSLPRVVVIGDQSSGKTSVLEMIAKARIFPRGSGEMMTRSPVKVTLSEGPYHVANLKGINREYDLTKESELIDLRGEIEALMKRSVTGGKTVSGDTIAMTVKGPGIQRMVLVDLPGVIFTETLGMAGDTKSKIQRMLKTHMENPNAIILCIQDGSLDAEKSLVTDLVSQIDPSGKRTIFVLTKVDLAENSCYNPDRIKKIMEGKLFPMKALGYFAVVTGKGNTNDTIEEIQNYEEKFFKNSKLFKEGSLKSSQMRTHNLSLAVSECFWKMVKGAIEQQADAFKATRFNLEAEWKNSYPKLRELTREELFEKGKGEILDKIVTLSLIPPPQWEEAFFRKMWEKVSSHVFESIYLPASLSTNIVEFNTAVDIKLNHWANKELPKLGVQVGQEVLEEQFSKLLDEKNEDAENDDMIFDKMKLAMKGVTMQNHQWDKKAEESLRHILLSTLQDSTVRDKQQWDSTIQFMEKVFKDKLTETEKNLRELVGPGTQEQWLKWRSKTEEQQNRVETIAELEKTLLAAKKEVFKPDLSYDEVTTVKNNLHLKGTEVENEFVAETWRQVFQKHFLIKSLETASDCKKGFYLYQKGFTNCGLQCDDVIMFWRIHKMLQTTSTTLRQQVVSNEARRLEKNIKNILLDFGESKVELKELFIGKRVDLAEKLKKVRYIQELLEEFIQALNKEK